MDRSYRLGQLRDVQVYRFVAQGTIEEVCYMRQIYKQQLNSLALEGVTVRRPPSPVAGKRKKKRGRTDSVKFDSVQGIKGEEGELFGVENLLRLQKEPFILDVRKKFHAEEVRKKDDKEKEEEKEGEKEKGEHGLNVTSTKVLESQVRDAVETAASGGRRKGCGKGEKENVDVECKAADIWGLLGVEVPEKEEEEEGEEEVDEVEEFDDDEEKEEEWGVETEWMQQGKKEKRRKKQHLEQEVEEDSEEEVEEEEEEEEEEKEGLPTSGKPLPAKLSVYKPAYVQKKKEAEEKKG
eukprot:evm.model.NODE_11899_length_10434_cov_23.175005.3